MLLAQSLLLLLFPHFLSSFCSLLSVAQTKVFPLLTTLLISRSPISRFLLCWMVISFMEAAGKINTAQWNVRPLPLSDRPKVGGKVSISDALNSSMKSSSEPDREMAIVLQASSLCHAFFTFGNQNICFVVYSGFSVSINGMS